MPTNPIDLFNAEESRDLAERMARAYERKHGSVSGFTLEDYHQLALLGLLEAAKRFTPELGHQFSHFAVRRIAGAIRDGVRQADEVKRYNRERGSVGPTVSLEHEVFSSDMDRFTWLKDLIAGHDVEDRTANCEELGAALGNLQFAQRAVIFLVHGVGLSQVQAASILGISALRVGEINQRAMDVLETTSASLF